VSAPPSRDDTAGRAYNDLRNKARSAHRPTQEFLQLYLLEAFLRRLASSSHSQNLVLKGGVLLAALGDRRPTKDVDLQARQLTNDADTTTQVICEIARLAADDGVAFDTEAATTEIIREDDGYRAYRVRMPASLATANLKFAVDISVGDPIEPSPQLVQLPCLLTDDTIELVAYPIVMVHAEKLVTALQRGTVNTRWRDFADIWTLSRHWDCNGTELQSTLTTVAQYRGATLGAIFPALEGYAELAQVRWLLWRAKQNLDTPLPEQFADVLTDIARFANPALLGQATGKTWKADVETWR